MVRTTKATGAMGTTRSTRATGATWVGARGSSTTLVTLAAYDGMSNRSTLNSNFDLNLDSLTVLFWNLLGLCSLHMLDIQIVAYMVSILDLNNSDLDLNCFTGSDLDS